MSNKGKTRSRLPFIKQTVDEIYEHLIQQPDGITMSVRKERGLMYARIMSKLVGRGIIEKQMFGRGKEGCRYRWVATMAPTKVLYGSIAQELADEDRAHRDSYKKKHAAKNKETPAVQPEEEKTPVNQSDPSLIEIAQSIGTADSQAQDAGSIDAVLSRYTIEEIWGYMKRHGCYIRDGVLTYTRTTYLF